MFCLAKHKVVIFFNSKCTFVHTGIFSNEKTHHFLKLPKVIIVRTTRRVGMRALFCNICLCFGQFGSWGPVEHTLSLSQNKPISWCTYCYTYAQCSSYSIIERHGSKAKMVLSLLIPLILLLVCPFYYGKVFAKEKTPDFLCYQQN